MQTVSIHTFSVSTVYSKHPLLLAAYSKLTLQCKGSFNWEGLDLGKGQEAARLDVGFFLPGLIFFAWLLVQKGTLLHALALSGGQLTCTCFNIGRDALDDSDTLICLCLL